MKALSHCANGDGNPVCPPSKVICRACLDKITSNLEDMLGDLRRQKNIESSQTDKQQPQECNAVKS
jgi:hypothetical protein